MDITITFANNEDYMIANVSGVWTLAGARLAIARAKEEALRTGLQHIILDIRDLALSAENMLRYETGTYIAEMFRPPYRIALVGGRPDLVNHFMETVTSNRGTRFRIFVEMEPALEWLLNNTAA